MDISRIESNIRASAAAVSALLDDAAKLSGICDEVIGALKAGGKLLTAGNGGSAAESLHMAEELVGRFRGNRASLPAISLVADSTALTCIANDFGYDEVFSRQVQGLGCPGDLLVLFSTSGSAVNLKLALDAAQRKGMRVICFLGRDGGALAGLGDMELIAPGNVTERIQEVHQLIIHLILDAVEETCP